MRSMVLTSCILVAALAPFPALAGDSGPGHVADKLNDPMTQYAVAGMLSAMSKAVLDMRVEPLVKAAGDMAGDRMASLPPDASVADLAGIDHDQVRDRIVESVPRAMSAMGAMAGALEKMVPEFEKMARAMRQAAPQL